MLVKLMGKPREILEMLKKLCDYNGGGNKVIVVLYKKEGFNKSPKNSPNTFLIHCKIGETVVNLYR